MCFTEGEKMTYEEIVEKLKKVYGKAKADKIEGHLAVQFDIVGEGEGALYIEVNDGAIDVQPYEYYDKNALVRITADVLMDIATGALDFESAYNEQKLWIEGDLGAALLLKNIDIKNQIEKPAEDNTKADVAKVNDTKADAAKVNDTKADAAKVNDTKADAAKADEQAAQKKTPARKPAKKTAKSSGKNCRRK